MGFELRGLFSVIVGGWSKFECWLVLGKGGGWVDGIVDCGGVEFYGGLKVVFIWCREGWFDVKVYRENYRMKWMELGRNMF